MLDRYSAATKAQALGRVPSEVGAVKKARAQYRDALYLLQGTLDIAKSITDQPHIDALLEDLPEAERAYVLRETTEMPA